MENKHKNIPIFIPHIGCPNDCVFCNQRSISGKSCFEPSSVRGEIESFLDTLPQNSEDVQIAFFGGSFTGIDRNEMIYLLTVAHEFIKAGRVSSVRLSTRPDYIDREILDILASFDVRSVELGIQSMSPRVLSASRRGHTIEASYAACRLIREYGFELVGQMMLGLPLSTPEDEIDTARALASLSVDAARIYPTVVFCGTELAEMQKRGEYTPLTTADAIQRAASVIEIFAENNIPTLRVGLQANEALCTGDGVLGGAFHPALGELAMSEFYMRKIRRKIEELPRKPHAEDTLVIYCAPGEVSKISGQKRENKLKIGNEYGVKNIKILEKTTLSVYNINLVLL